MPGRWWSYTDVLSDTGHDYFALEMTASQIMIFAARQVPGLLQTGAYAGAVSGAMRDVSAAESERLREAYQARQESVLDGSRPTGRSRHRGGGTAAGRRRARRDARAA